MSQARRRRVSPYGVRLAYLAGVVLAFGLGFGLGRRSQESEPVEPELAVDGVSSEAPAAAPAVDDSAADLWAVGVAPSPGAPLVALVIDDLGRSVATIESLESLGVSLTYSVLPFESRTAEVVAYLERGKLETLCHVPMEAQSGLDPGPGALRRSMSPTEIQAATMRALAAVPPAVGVNNHMGSAFSEDAEAMAHFLEVLAARRLFFLDSRTSAETTGLEVATRLGVAIVERNVFLDRDRAPERIREEFRRALELASGGTPAVAIGHPYAETLDVLRQEVPRARAQGYTFVTVSDLLEGL